MAVLDQVKIYSAVFGVLSVSCLILPYVWSYIQLAGAFCILCMLARRITTEYNRQKGKTPVNPRDKVSCSRRETQDSIFGDPLRLRLRSAIPDRDPDTLAMFDDVLERKRISVI